MTLDEYQEIAGETDQFDVSDSEGIIVALLGLAGESGSLLTLFKKKMRDGEAYEPIQRHVREELGDVLWYISAIARRSGISHSKEPYTLDQNCGCGERIARYDESG
jgi:NTP pyrophosphatase (non-canonical NTP hydrolase)